MKSVEESSSFNSLLSLNVFGRIKYLVFCHIPLQTTSNGGVSASYRGIKTRNRGFKTRYWGKFSILRRVLGGKGLIFLMFITLLCMLMFFGLIVILSI